MKINGLLMIVLMSSGAMWLPGCSKDSEYIPVERQIAWAVGQRDSANSSGVILYTENGGDTWTRQGDLLILKDIDIINVIAVDQLTAWAVGNGNALFNTKDGGKTWAGVDLPQVNPVPDLSSISTCDGRNIWISGGNGKAIIYKSSDGGSSWTLQDTTLFKAGYMQGIFVITPEVVYAVGNNTATRGIIARTRNGGATWDTMTPPGDYNKFNWIGVRATDTSHICIYGQASHYILTSDGFQTWMLGQYGQGGPAPDFNCLVMLDNERYWAACDFNNILYTGDSGLSWVRQPSTGNSNLFLVGIDVYSDEFALITGQSAGWPYAGNILKTTDGGKTWVEKYTINSDLYKVSFARR